MGFFLYKLSIFFKIQYESHKLSLYYQVLVGLVNTLTTVLALVIIDKVGRKKLVYYGVSGMVVS
ncbi:MFS transporter, partial [Bacteroides sp. NSJ-39]